MEKPPVTSSLCCSSIQKAWDPLSALSYYFLSPICPQSKISLVKFGWLVASSTLWLQASFIVRIRSNYHTTIQGARQPTAARTSVSGYCRCHSLVRSFSLCLLQSCLSPLILTTLWKHWSLDHRTLFKLHTVYGSCGLLHQYTCTHFSRESAHCWCVSQSPHSNTSHSQIAFLLGQSRNVGHASPARVQHLETQEKKGWEILVDAGTKAMWTIFVVKWTCSDPY